MAVDLVVNPGDVLKTYSPISSHTVGLWHSLAMSLPVGENESSAAAMSVETYFIEIDSVTSKATAFKASVTPCF